jgi:hypothetical protein
MQRFEQSCVLPADAATVIAAISTEAYLRYRYADVSLHEFRIEISQDDASGFACVVTRRGSTAKLPGMVRKLAGDSLTMTQSQDWDRKTHPYQGRLNMALEGIPGHINTRMSLVDNGDGSSTLQVRGEMEARIPLFGGQIEKMLLSRVEEAFDNSAQAIRAYIETHC